MAPGDNNLRLRYARHLYRVGKFAGAETLLLPMLRSGTQPEAVADVLIEYGGQRPTAEMLEQLAAGATPPVAAAAARIALEKGYSDLAMRLMAPYFGGDMSPSVAAAAGIFAAAKQQAGLSAEAMQVAERVLAFDSDNPRALRVRAQVSLERRRLDEALTDARVLVRDQPLDADNRTLLARILEARGDRRQAEATFRQALNDMPGNKRLLQDYAAFLRRQKRTTPSPELAESIDRSLAKS
jgi:Tfp pilus assembly protein PilF